MIVNQMAHSKQSMNDVHLHMNLFHKEKKLRPHEVNSTHEQIFLFLFTIFSHIEY